MRDSRVEKLAYQLVHNSCAVQKGDQVLIENIGLTRGLVTALVEEVYKAGGFPFVWLKDPAVDRALAMHTTAAQQDLSADLDGRMMAQMQCYIGLRSGDNKFELGDVPEDRQSLIAKRYWHTVHSKIRVPKTRWVVLRYPTASMAQNAKMSTEAFEDFYFDVCCLDYAKMSRAMDNLVSLMNVTDKVRIVGEGTDLSFSIKDIPAIKCDGHMNIPDGEVYTAPVRDSINGVITYNTPSLYQGFTFERIRLTFKDGKIVDAQANDTARINKIFDIDEGARYVGEFAIGVNPYINQPMLDTLFDEKIAGSFHFTPGSCYDDCSNGNKSAIHWDLVCIQTPEYGGGEMYFDDQLVRKDGRFVIDSLEALNPENLK